MRVQSRVYRKIFEEYYGIKIPKDYHIHHIDGNRNNNNPENLQMLSPEEHFKVHLDQNDPVCKHGKFISGASDAGKIGGKSRSDRKRKASANNLKINRRPDLGGKSSVESRKKQKTFFFSEEYQDSLHKKMKKEMLGPWSDEHIQRMSKLGKSKGKSPRFNDKKWISTYDASIDTGIPASTIRYRCRNKILGWFYDE